MAKKFKLKKKKFVHLRTLRTLGYEICENSLEIKFKEEEEDEEEKFY